MNNSPKLRFFKFIVEYQFRYSMRSKSSISCVSFINVINVPQKFNFEISLIHWLQLGFRTFLGDRFHGFEPSRRTLRPVKRKTETKIISAGNIAMVIMWRHPFSFYLSS